MVYARSTRRLPFEPSTNSTPRHQRLNVHIAHEKQEKPGTKTILGTGRAQCIFTTLHKATGKFTRPPRSDADQAHGGGDDRAQEQGDGAGAVPALPPLSK